MGPVSSAMTAIANDRDDHLLVFCVASENILKAICHVKEFFLQSNFALKQFRFDMDLQIVVQTKFFLILCQHGGCVSLGSESVSNYLLSKWISLKSLLFFCVLIIHIVRKLCVVPFCYHLRLVN